MTADPKTEVVRARAELAAALDALEGKLNVPKRTKRAVGRLTTWAKENPVVSGGIAASALAGIAGATVLAVKLLRR